MKKCQCRKARYNKLKVLRGGMISLLSAFPGALPPWICLTQVMCLPPTRASLIIHGLRVWICCSICSWGLGNSVLVGRLEGGSFGSVYVRCVWWNYTTHEEMKVWMKWRWGGVGSKFFTLIRYKGTCTKMKHERKRQNKSNRRLKRESVASEMSNNFWYLFTKVLNTFAHKQVCANQQLEGRIAELDDKNAQHHGNVHVDGHDKEHIDKSVVVVGGFKAETVEDQSINQTCMPAGSPFGRWRSSEAYLICTRLYKHQEPPQTHNVDHFQCLQKWMTSSVRCSQSAIFCANICHSSICKNRTKAESLVAQLCLGHPALWSSWDHGGSRSIGPTDDGAHCWLQKRGNDWWGISPRIGDFWASNARHEIHQISKQGAIHTNKLWASENRSRTERARCKTVS